MLPILMRDDRYVILDKPAGLPVHSGRDGGPSVEDWFPLLSRRRTGPWLAHRLDRDTSGCLLIALRRPALVAAQACFATGQASKVYWAIVRGCPGGSAGEIEAPLRKWSGTGGWRMEVHPDGQRASSAWRVLGRADGLAWLEIRPRTGRTHQVRAHCAYLGCPVLGDSIYGGGHGKLQLLARHLAMPVDPPVSATAPPPTHMLPALARCGFTPA